jgi:ABC-2 type transport system permease protein
MTVPTFSVSIDPSLSRWSPAAELRALGAVARKSWTIFRRYPSWIISLLIWPLIFPAAYLLTGRALAGPDGSGLAVFRQATGINDFVGYIGVGTTIWMWQNVVLWNVGYALRDEQMQGTLESNWLSPTWRFSFLLGSSLVQFLNMVVFILVAFAEFSLLLGVRFQGSPGVILLMFLASVPAIYGIAFTFASLVMYAKEANSFVFLVRGLVMIFCGITFPVSILPGWMQAVAGWLPPTYIIHGLRGAMLQGADLPAILPDILALLGFGAFWLIVGFLCFRWMERRARQTGALGQY